MFSWRSILIFLLMIQTCCRLDGQEVISIDLTDNVPVSLGQILLNQLGITVRLDVGVDVYRVTYTATGSDGLEDTASGLLMLPEEVDGTLPLLIYQHGTTDGREDVPSNLQGGFQLGLIFAAKNMAVLAPDFLGLGTSRGFHPYVHAETEATASVDMMDAVLPWMEENDITWNEQVFIAGYSQGGHAAMALHQYLQEQAADRYTVTASLPMSGPYSISGVMRDLIFTDESYNFPAYLVYSTRGIREIYPDLYEDEADIFKAPYLPAIRRFIDSGNGLFDLNSDLVRTLIDETGSFVPKDLFRDSILNIIETEDDHPFNLALRQSDLFDWRPEAPVFMLYCPSDDQVPFTNSIIADSVMNANGAPSVMSMDVSGGRDLDHTDCIVPALNTGIPWLLGFIDTTTPTSTIPFGETTVYPNPTSRELFIQYPDGITSVNVLDITGQLLFTEQYDEQSEIELDLGDLDSGLYLIDMRSNDLRALHKVIIR